MAKEEIIIKAELQIAQSRANIKKLNQDMKNLDMRFTENKLKVKQLANEELKLAKAKQSLIKTNKQLISSQKQQKSATGGATSSAMELSRVISDAPYGIRGMANNITQLVSQLGYQAAATNVATGTTYGYVGAIKAMWSALIGPLGVVFAITAVVSALDYFFGAQKKAKGSTDDLKSSFDELASAMRNNVNTSIRDYIKLVSKKEEVDKRVLENDEKAVKVREKLSDITKEIARTEELQSNNAQDFTYYQEQKNKLLKEEAKLKKEQWSLFFDSQKQINGLKDSRDDFNRSIEGSLNWYNEEIALLKKQQASVKISSVKYKELTKSISEYETELSKLLDNDALKGSVEWYEKEISVQEDWRSSFSKSSKDYKEFTEEITRLQKELEKITGSDTKTTSKKFSPFKTKKELEIDVKDNEKALLDLSRKIKIQELKNEEATELLGAKNADEKFQIKKKYAERLLEIQLTSEKKQLILRKSIERAVMQEKFKNFQTEAMLRLQAYKDKVSKSGVGENKKKELIQNAEGDTASLITSSNEELNISVGELDEKYNPIFEMFDKLAILRRKALGLGGEGTSEDKEKELGSLQDYLDSYKELMSGVSDFISAEYDRQMAIEQNKTNALNEELNNRLLNENLSKEERARIQNQIGQNDEKLRKKQEAIARKQFNTAKAFNIGMATVETYLAAQKAYTSQLVVGDPTSLVRAKIAAGVAVASGLVNVAAIARTKFQSTSASTPVNVGGGGSGGGEGVGDREFNFNLVGNTQSNQLLETLQSQFERPLQAFVVSKDITTQQELDANIRSGASI